MLDESDRVYIDAPAGSLIVTHGNVWHGASARTKPGLRLSVLLYYCRSSYVPEEDYRGRLPEEVFARNKKRLRWMARDYIHQLSDASEGHPDNPMLEYVNLRETV